MTNLKLLPITIKNLNIEVNAKYNHNDNYDFTENIKRYDNSNLFQYIDYGNIDLLDASELFHIKSSNKKDKLIETLDYFNVYQNTDGVNKDELIEMIYNIPVNELISHSWSNRQSLGDLLEVTKKYELVTTIGYSQGDVMDIIVPHKLIDIWGSKKSDLIEWCEKGGPIQKELSNYCWDSLIEGDFNLSFNYYVNCVTHSFEIEQEDEHNNLSDYLVSQYEMKFDSQSIIYQINNELRDKGFMLSVESEDILKNKLSKYGYEDVSHGNCVC